jgi:hypothetical protein
MTTRSHVSRTKKTPRSKPASVLEQLEDGEAHALLRRLLAAHPDLRTEAEKLARALLCEVRFESVADDVEQALRTLNLDDLGSRAGRRRDGYTSPTEAAWQLLEEAVDPFLSDLKRHLELGLYREALEICKGVVLGLYRLRRASGHEFLEWAEDFPTEAAADALRILAGNGEKLPVRGGRPGPHIDEDFVNGKVPEWRELIVQAMGV